MQNCRTAPRSYCRFIKIFRRYFFKHSVHVSLSLWIFSSLGINVVSTELLNRVGYKALYLPIIHPPRLRYR